MTTSWVMTGGAESLCCSASSWQGAHLCLQRPGGEQPPPPSLPLLTTEGAGESEGIPGAPGGSLRAASGNGERGGSGRSGPGRGRRLQHNQGRVTGAQRRPQVWH